MGIEEIPAVLLTVQGEVVTRRSFRHAGIAHGIHRTSQVQHGADILGFPAPSGIATEQRRPHTDLVIIEPDYKGIL